jgi:hypothetical protein
MPISFRGEQPKVRPSISSGRRRCFQELVHSVIQLLGQAEVVWYPTALPEWMPSSAVACWNKRHLDLKVRLPVGPSESGDVNFIHTGRVEFGCGRTIELRHGGQREALTGVVWGGWLAPSFFVTESTMRSAVVARMLPGNSVSVFS